MLSYQHSYHAGCFADVMKHSLLTRLLHYLVQKEKPLLYLDTHSGRGRYDLQHKHALKTNEAALGIHLLWEKRAQLPPLFSPYIAAISQLNQNNILRYYPGSPEIAIQSLRQQDRLVFCELHPAEFSFLRQLRRRGHRILLKNENGLMHLNTFLPPIERRGLVFMDPSYERKIEYQEMVQAIKAAHKRCSTITYCLWYPFINHQLPPRFLKSLAAIAPENSLRLEFHLTQKPDRGMTGSGLWIINPPYTLADEADKMLQTLASIFQPKSASHLVEIV